MALAYLFDPNMQFQDRNGVNNVSGFLRVYYEGTDDRATTYKNFIGTLNPADIPIDNNGRAVVIVDEEKTYRLEVYERNGNLLWTQHPLCVQGGGGGSFEQVQSNWDEEDPTSAAFIKNKPDLSNFLEKTGDGKDVTVTFNEASERTNIGTGEKLSVLFGKIKKWFTDLATVAFSGSYNDLSNKPTIPAPQVQSDWNEADNTKADYIKNKPNLASVATSGSYNDLSGKPSIPAAQVNSDWNANSGVAQILNKPDLSQYIPSSQKGAANGVGTLGSNSVQPYSEMYKGYVVEGEAVFKLCRIPKTTAYSGGVSFVFTNRAYNKSSGQVLLWVSPCEYQDSNVVYKVVNLFSRANDVSMLFYYNEVTVDGNSYVDVYYKVYGSGHTHVMPLWMRGGVQDMLSTSPVTLPEGAVEMTSRFFNVCAAKDGVGSASVPVYVDSYGNAIPCTLATVASTGSYNDLSNKPTIPAVDQTYNEASQNPQSGVALASHMIRPILLSNGPTGLSHTETFSSSVPQYFDWVSGNYNIIENVLYIADFIVQASGYKNTSVNIEIWAKKTEGKTWIGKLSVPLCRGIGYGQIILYRNNGIAFEFSVDIEPIDFSVGDEITVIPSFRVG